MVHHGSRDGSPGFTELKHACSDTAQKTCPPLENCVWAVMLQAIDSDHERCAHDAWRALLCPAPLPKAVLVNGTWQAPPFAEASGPHSRSWSAGGIFASIIPREIYFYMCVKLVGPYAQATLANAYLTLDGCTKSSPLPSNSMLFQVAEGRRIKKITRKPSLPTLILGVRGRERSV